MKATVKELVLNAEWCKGCGICAEFCPKNVLKLDNGKAVIIQPENCISCGLCELLCPDFALYFDKTLVCCTQNA